MEGDEEKITPEEFSQIREIVEVFNASNFDYLTLELAGMKLTVGTGAAQVPNAVGTAGSGLALPPDPKTGEQPVATVAREPAGLPAQSQTDSESTSAEAAKVDDGSVAVVAPTMGTFYSRPDPSSPPFAKVGTPVDADETVGLIEIMKVFNNVNAGISGIVTEVCVADGEAVEFGQVIMRIRPSP